MSIPSTPVLRAQRGFALLRILAVLAAAGVVAVVGVLGYFFIAIYPNVPAIDAVTDYKPKIPLRIYTADKVLIGEFGEEHRDFVPIKQVPELMKKAVLAIEDTRFYEHGGIDWIRALAAARANLSGGFRQGGSTITMQVARNFFLSRDKKISRKINEVALAYKIEQALSKDQILELYMNQIYLGRRSYGFGSAARAYFGKDLSQLTVGEMAMLAGIPQDPVRHNPAVNPHRAKQRQEVVLRRMRDVGFISAAQYANALAEPMHIASTRQEFDTHAEYVAELVRQEVVAEYKEDAYTRGLSVYTTIGKAEQDAAYESVRRNVLAYDQRHGYRGPEAFIELPQGAAEREDAINEALRARPSSDGLLPVVVTEVDAKSVKVENLNGDSIAISGAGLHFATPALAAKAKPAVKLRPGAVIRIAQTGKLWAITQVPLVAASFVAIDTHSGAYHALVGGFDYNLQKYNHVTQAWRQPGSSMKPFIYSAALEHGYSPGTQILDEPLDMPGENAGATWSPQNDDGVYDGQVTMRHALAHSKNVPSVRLLRAVGVAPTLTYLTKFGFTSDKQPRNLTLALGTGAVTPLQMAGAYAVFANGGYQIKPYLVAKIVDAGGQVLAEVKPAAPLEETARMIDPRNAFIMDTMLRDVTRFGTGAQAAVKLGRTDIAGKTGTTSDAVDGWFAGYGANVVAVAWMGYDDPKSLGGREFGATLALPIWIDYMRVALAGQPAHERTAPEGVMRQDDDWIYSEYAGTSDFKTIDIDTLPTAVPETEAPPAPATE
ncbi:MAG: PBP1A family penicillin-binding protein [Pseudomonadota bacterium]